MRGVFMTLAALALALKVAIPAGYMTRPAATDDLPFALVLCTAQGAVAIQPDGQGAPEPAANHASPCLFAGHGAMAPPLGLSIATPVTFVVYRAAQPRRLVDLAPGRGLAAPPLPARGPPSLLT